MILCFDLLTLLMRFPPPFRHKVYMVLIEAKGFLSIVSPMNRLLNYSEKNMDICLFYLGSFNNVYVLFFFVFMN